MLLWLLLFTIFRKGVEKNQRNNDAKTKNKNKKRQQVEFWLRYEWHDSTYVCIYVHINIHLED